MTFYTEIDRDNCRPVVLLEVTLNSGTRRYASRAVRESTAFWDGRLTGNIQIDRSLDPGSAAFNLTEVSVSLMNTDGYFDDLVVSETWRNAAATLSLGFILDDGSLVKEPIYKGVVSPKSLDIHSFTISLRSEVRERLGILQRTLEKTAFPNISDEQVGQGMNIVLGGVKAKYGAVRCQVTDAAARKGAICQHAIGGASNFYRIKGGARTAIPVSEVTVDTAATDGNGETVSTFVVSAAYWDAEAEYFCDVNGLTWPDPQNTIYNLVWAIRQLMMDYSDLTVDSFGGSWSDAATDFSDSSFDSSTKSGILIPREPGQIEQGETQWKLIQDCLWSIGYAPVVSTSGTIELKSLDMTASGDPVVTYYDRDLKELAPRFSFDSVEVVNKGRVNYAVGHSSTAKTEKYVQGDNSASKDAFGTREQMFINRAAQDGDLAGAILTKDLRLKSGKATEVSWTVPGIKGFQAACDVGDLVGLNHPRSIGDLVYVTGKSASISISGEGVSYSVSFKGLMVGSNYVLGAIKLSQEVEETLTANLDTYFSEYHGSSSFGSQGTMYHGMWDNLNEELRTVIRFPTSSIPSTAAIQRVTIILFVKMAVPYGSSSIVLRPTTISKGDWLESGSWNNVDGIGTSWTDAFFDTQVVDNQIIGSGTLTLEFNAAGISAVASKVAAGQDLNISFMGLNDQDLVEFSSRDDADVSRRPRIVVVYTA